MTDSPLPPLLRLKASRERLRAAMMPPPSEATPHAAMRRPTNSVQRWLISLRRWPLVGEVAGSLGDWWVRHPLRPVARIASDASAAAVGPVARQHPLALVGTAAAVGAVVLWISPWKWLIRTALYAGLVPQLASKIVSKLPLESWLTLLGTMIASKSHVASTQPVVVRGSTATVGVAGSGVSTAPGVPPAL